MRTFIILIAVMALSGCHRFVKRGSGHVTTEDRTVTPFTKVSIDGVFPVEISQNGGIESVKVETDENLQPTVTVQMYGDTLLVKSKDHETLGSSSKMKVYINIKKIDGLDFKSVGKLSTANTLKLDSLTVNSESVGKLHLDIDADFLRANLESVGSTVFTGKVREARINNKSVGSLSAFDLKAKTMMIHNTSIGFTEVYADSAFYIRSSAVGSLYYKGPAEVKELKSEGIGRVQKKE